MGGNIFKNEFNSVRISTETFHGVSDHARNILMQFFDRVSIVPSYGNKESHGDVDILVCSQFHDLSKRTFIDWLSACEVPHSINSDVVSFLYDLSTYDGHEEDLDSGEKQYVQVDVIVTESRNFDIHFDYLCYNDASNLRGRISHMLGLKLGHTGLSYIHREGDQVLFELHLSRNTSYIDKFLGFPDCASRKFWSSGPDTLEDIFEYITSSKYFNPDIYLLHNRNHYARTRDKKRKTYQEFLKYCETLKDQIWFEKPEDKQPYIQSAIDFFGVRKEYEDLLELVEKDKARKEKFNGDIVRNLTGLCGKELGIFMMELRQILTDETIDLLSEKTILSIVTDVYQKTC